jgi:preprotein translocase subunit SecE
MSSVTQENDKKGLWGGFVHYVRESYHELTTKVTWPKGKTLWRDAMIVLFASLLFALLIGAMDFIFKTALTFFYEQI